MQKMMVLPILFVILTIFALNLSATPTVHGQIVGVVCVAAPPITSTSGCPTSPVNIAGGAVGTKVVVGINIDSSDALNGFRIFVKTDITILNPVKADLNNTLLAQPILPLANCVNDKGLGCSLASGDGPGVVDVGVVSLAGLTLAPTTGNLFEIVYSVVAPTTGTPVNFLTGVCGVGSSVPGLCVTITNGGAAPNLETAMTGTVITLPTFVLSANPSSLTINAGSSLPSTITVSRFLSGTGTVSLTRAITPVVTSGPTALLSVASGSLSNSVNSFTSILTVSTTASTPPGNYNATVTGTCTTTSCSSTTRSIIVPVTVQLPPPPHPTTTTVQCTPPSVRVSTATSCMATVTDTSATGATTPGGSVSFTTNSTGTFAPVSASCTLSAGATVGTASCPVSYTPGSAAVGHHLINGTYTGDSSHSTSHGTFNLAVTPIPFDYSLSNSGPVSIVQGSSGPITIKATLTAGSAVPVTLSCATPLPTGVSCNFASPTVTPTLAGATDVLTISTTSSTPTGLFTLVVNGSPVGATASGATTTVSVTVTSIPFDYSLSNNGPVSIVQGSSGTVTVTATLKAGTAQPVTLSCSGLPLGITCSGFTVNPVTPTGSSVLTVNVAASVAPGPYSFTVSGSPLGATTTPTTVSLTVTAIPFDYALSNNGPVSVVQGSSGTVTITATLKAGTAQSVILSCTGLPAGVTCGSFTVNPVTPALAGATSVLTINVGASVTTGPHSFLVNGSPVGATASGATTTVSVTVTAIPFDYSLSNNGPITVQQGSSAPVTITATLKTGTSQPVTLSCMTPLPTGVSCTFAAGSNPVTPTGSSVLTISTSASTPLGPLTVMVTGSPLGATTTPTSVSVTVSAVPFDYSLSNNGPVSITAGSSGTVTVTATLKAGTAQMVTLSCVSSSLPVGITCSSFTVNPVTPTGSSVLTINVAASVAAGPYSFTVTGAPLGVTTTPTTVSATVTIIPFDYSLSNNGPVSITAGSSGTVTVTSTLKAGSTQPVTLSCSGLPVGITCGGFTVNPVTPTGSSVLTINVASSVAAGPYTFTVTGSPLGATTTPTTISVTVTAVPFDYSLSNNGPITVQQGSTAPVTITATLKAGTAQPVTLSCSGLPLGITCSGFTVNPVTPTGSSVLTVNVAASVAPGPYSFTVSGSPLGATTTPTTVSLTVTAIPFDYALSNNGPVSVVQGSSGTVTVTVRLTAGSALPVSLSCVSSSLPAGVTCGSFTVNPVTPTAAGATSVLTVNVASSVALGPYSFMVTGSPLGATTTPTSVSLTVTPAQPHATATTISCNPSSFQVGSQTTCTATVTDTSSSTATAPTGTVGFTTNSTGTFSPASATCTLTLGTTAGAASCSVSYTPTVAGHDLITGSYTGDSTHSGSTGSFKLAVTSTAPPPLHSTKTVVTCSPGSVPVGTSTSCTARVMDNSTSPTVPTGTVTFTTNSTGSFNPASATCTLVAGNAPNMATCSVSYAPTIAGKHLITGSYAGDSGHAKSSGGFTVNVRSLPGGSVLLTFTGYNLDDFDNTFGQLEVLVNGQLVVDIPAGLNHLTGTGDYNPYGNTAVDFGPFDITSILVSGQNTVLFKDPTSVNHFGIVSNVLIVQGDNILLQASRARGVSLGSSFSYTFSNPPLKISSFTSSPAAASSNQMLTFTATFTGGTAPFTCIFRFGDGESRVVVGRSGACSATHDYDQPGTFTATVTIRGSSTSDLVRSRLTTSVTGGSS